MKYSMYEYERTTLVKTSVSFNFVKHWPMRNLFNDEIFPIYGISLTYTAKHHIACFIIVKPGPFGKPRALAKSQNDILLPERSLQKAVSMWRMKSSAELVQATSIMSRKLWYVTHGRCVIT